MITQLHGKSVMDGLRIEQDVSAVVIRTAAGDPVVICMEMGDAVLTTTADDPEFEKMLIDLGFDRRSVPRVEKVSVPRGPVPSRG